MPPIHVLNTSAGDTAISLVPLTFGSPIVVETGFDRLPRSGPAILYIVAHAVPNGLLTADGQIMTEQKLLEKLQYRKGLPTLLIFDACFAKSFSKIPDLTWPSSFGLIFSCLEYESTWNEAVPGSPRQSLFSRAIDSALNAYRANRDLPGLKDALIKTFDGLQNPYVQASDALLQDVLGLSEDKAAE